MTINLELNIFAVQAAGSYCTKAEYVDCDLFKKARSAVGMLPWPTEVVGSDANAIGIVNRFMRTIVDVHDIDIVGADAVELAELYRAAALRGKDVAALALKSLSDIVDEWSQHCIDGAKVRPLLDILLDWEETADLDTFTQFDPDLVISRINKASMTPIDAEDALQ